METNMTNDYKETAYNASQMLLRVASFVRANKGVSVGGLTEKELFEMSTILMDDVRALYKEEK